MIGMIIVKLILERIVTNRETSWTMQEDEFRRLF